MTLSKLLEVIDAGKTRIVEQYSPIDFTPQSNLTIGSTTADVRTNQSIVNFLNAPITIRASTFTVTFNNVHFRNARLFISSTTNFNNCEFFNCIFNISTTATTVTFTNCYIKACDFLGGNTYVFTSSEVEFSFGDSSAVIQANVSTSLAQSTFITACEFQNISTEGTLLSGTNNFVPVHLVDCNILDLVTANSYSILTSVQCRRLKINGSFITGVGLNVDLPSGSGIDNALVSISGSFITITGLVIRNQSTSPTHMLNFSNLNTCSITGFTGENTVAGKTLVNVNSVQNLQVLGVFNTNISTAMTTSGSNSNVVIMVNPITYVVGTFTASTSATSHTVTTGVTGAISRLFIQGRTQASENYSSLTINSPANGQFTVTYSSAITAELHYEAYSAVI